MADVKRGDPKAFEKFTQKLEQLGKYQVKVGWFENNKEENGIPSAYAAAIQEFGHGKIPPRLGLRETLEKQKTSTRDFAKNAAKQVAAGKWSGWQAAEAIGMKTQSDFYKRINSNPSPALSRLTLALRYRRENGLPITGGIIGGISAKLKAGESVPMSSNTQTLVDTGRMLNNLNSKVEDA